MAKYSSLTDTFFNRILLKDFLSFNSDDNSSSSFDYNKEYYNARYDNFFELNNISETELKQIINSFKTKFIEDNDSFDEEVFRNSYSFGINLFLDEIQDYLNSLKKGKAYNIERCNNKFIHHFELSSDVSSGKTIIISTKDIDQIHIYFNKIKQIINETISKKLNNSKSSLSDNELKGFKIENYNSISKFRKKLIEFDFIDKEISLKDFRKIFDGEKFTEKIIWKNSLNHLHSMIKLMFEENIISKDEKKKWVITAKSFSLLDKEGIKEFDSNKVRTANKIATKAEDSLRNILKSSNLL